VKDWHLTFGQSGAILFASGVASIPGGIFFGWLGDKIGRRAVFLMMILILSLGTGVTAVFCSTSWLSSHPSLRIARQRLQSQCRARQRAHRRAPAVNRSINGPRRCGRGHRRRCRSSPDLPLLRRSHDHRRELPARRRTPRPAATPSQSHQRNAVTPLTNSAHTPPAGELPFRRCIAVAPPSPRAIRRNVDQAKIAPATTAPVTKSLLLSSCSADHANKLISRLARRTVKSP
jgi:hypothetical protein